MIGRRELITLLGGALGTARPIAASGQQSLPTIGYLSTGTPGSDAVPFLRAFHQGLREVEYVEAQNLLVEYRFAEFQNERLPALASDLVARPVNVLATIGGTPSALVAKAATSTIPIVFYSGVDPVQFGLVAGGVVAIILMVLCNIGAIFSYSAATTILQQTVIVLSAINATLFWGICALIGRKQTYRAYRGDDSDDKGK